MSFKCPFCGNTGKDAIKAHIIPRAFFEAAADGHVLIQRGIGIRPKRSRRGIYDSGIWCNACEEKYQYLDDLAVKVFLNKDESQWRVLAHAYEIPLSANDLSSLNLFFVSLLWRASQSTQRFYRDVSIGPFASPAKELIKGFPRSGVDEFSAIISRSDADERLLTSPARFRCDGVLFYKFHLGRYVANIKVSSDRTPNALRPAVVGEKDCLVVLRTKRDAKLVKAVTKIANAQLRKGA